MTEIEQNPPGDIVAMAGPVVSADESGAASTLPWLTGEVALYIGLVVVAAVVRIVGLGRWPLLRSEADTALAAWRTLQGSSWRPGLYNPLLYDVHLLLFGLTTASDGAVRLLSALAGTLLVGLPYFARDALGRRGALMASILLAFSPTWMFFSRVGDGPILSALTVAALLIFGVRYWRERRPADLRIATASLALSLVAGPGIYTFVLSALVWAAASWLHRRRQPGWDDERRALVEGLKPVVCTPNLLLFGGILLVAATAFSFNMGGIGATASIAGQWVRELFSWKSPWYAMARALLTYESLTVVLALVGAVWGLWRRDREEGFLVVWAAIGLLLGLAGGQSSPQWLPGVLLPLVFLAGRGFERVWAQLLPGTTWRDGLALWLAICLLAFASLELASYLHNGQAQFLQYAWIAFGVLCIGILAHGFWSGARAGIRAGVVLVLIVVGVLTVRASTAIGYQTSRDPREVLVSAPSSPQIRSLEETIRDAAYHRAGDPSELSIEYDEDLDPWLGWYLREYPLAEPVSAVTELSQAMVLIAPANGGRRPASNYVGRRYRLTEEWRPQNLTSRERLRWLIYRDSVGVEEPTDIQLWLRMGER